MGDLEAGRVLADMIDSAEITFRDKLGRHIFTMQIGKVFPGCIITQKVPEAEDFHFTTLPDGL